MTKFVFIYHGGTKPESPEQVQQEMQAWGAWFESMGKAVVVPGAPVGQSVTVSSAGVTQDGGSNPASGYTVVEAEDIDQAIELAKGCPIMKTGSIEVAPEMDM